MGFFDKLNKLAEQAANAVIKTSEKISDTYQKEGFDGVVNKTVNKTAESFNKAGQKTQAYFDTISDKNKKIMDSIPETDLEAKLAKATAVVINTTQTLVKDAAKKTVEAVDNVSKNLEQMVAEKTVEPTSEVNTPPVKKAVSDVKELFLNEAQIAELDCMPIKLYVKHLGAQHNFDGQQNKYQLDGITFVVENQKWYDFNNNKGGIGSLAFINHYVRVKNGLLDNVHVEVQKEIRNSSFDILSKLVELKEYQDDLSSWIKEENERVKKSQPKAPVSEDKPKRVRKPATKSVASETKEEPKTVAKKTVKKPLVVESAPLKAVAKKAAKKVVKEAVDATPEVEVKTRKKPKA